MFLKPLERKLKVRFFEPDRASPMGDPDFVSQQVAGLLDDGRLWRLTVADAAHLMDKGRITMSLVTPGGQEVPLHVARSSRGRRYLRTPADDDITNNLANLRGSLPSEVWLARTRFDDLFVALGGSPARSGYQTT